ncbi:MAG: DGQHR domain-containing protein [Firmicutes bacterium]|nr:DGQHR domain-containing protein [Bacillota bacterium]
MKTIYLFEISQPIGTFYIGKMMSVDLLKIAKSETRNIKGIQRVLSSQRTQSIANYCKDPDAIFPTPIILAIDSEQDIEEDIEEDIDGNITNSKFSLINVDNSGVFKFTYSDDIRTSILDGQHRLFGIQKSETNFELPIAIAFNLTEEQKAYIFSTINSNQKQVDKSLIYDLFELSTYRSPHKTSHYLARLFNYSSESPFYGRLKMLEKRTDYAQSLSQGTFVSYITGLLISNNPKQDMIDIKNNKGLKDNVKYPLRKYFIQDADDAIYKILLNYFSSVKEVFNEEWNDYNNYILSKSTGFGALIRAAKEIIPIGEKNKTLDLSFFKKGMSEFKKVLENEKLELTSLEFPSNHQQQARLSKIIIKAFSDIY